MGNNEMFQQYKAANMKSRLKIDTVIAENNIDNNLPISLWPGDIRPLRYKVLDLVSPSSI